MDNTHTQIQTRTRIAEEGKEEKNGTHIEEKQVQTEIIEKDNNNINNNDNNDDDDNGNKDSNFQSEVAPALITLHPFDHFVTVAVGPHLRVFDLVKNCPISLDDDCNDVLHKDSIRAMRFSEKGNLLVSAGDDKLVKIWSTETWKCFATINSEKRVSAVAISKDEQYVCFADKFGVVWVVNLTGLTENQSVPNMKGVAIFGHYCSIITSLEFSPDGRFIVSADRDFKIRVSVFPKDPLNGVHEIQSFCLGHSEFVTCLTFVHNSDFPNGFLLSGSGDSTVCLWDVSSGSLLCKSNVESEADFPNEGHPAVTDLCATPDGSLVAVAIQGMQGILLLSCDLSAKVLSTLKVVLIPEQTFIPTRLYFSGEMLWMVTGASNVPGSKAATLAHVKVMSNFNNTDGHVNPRILGDDEVPGGKPLLEKLQGTVSIESDVFTAAAEAVNAAMSNLLRKKQYSDEKRDFKKRTRNDKKYKG